MKSKKLAEEADAIQEERFGTKPLKMAKTIQIKIKQNKEYPGWIVQVFINGKLNEDKSYHTDCYEDAQNTRCNMVMEAKEHPECYQN